MPRTATCTSRTGATTGSRGSPPRAISSLPTAGRDEAAASCDGLPAFAVDERDRLYVSDWGNERVQVLDGDGNPLQVLRGEATLSRWAAGFLETNREEGRARASANLEPDIASLDPADPHAESAHIEKLFWSPMSVKLDDAGRLYVTDGNRHRIQVYRRTSQEASLGRP